MKILIWQARHRKRVSLRKLEELTGIPKSTLWNIENGKRPANLNQLEAIARALHMRISELYESDIK